VPDGNATQRFAAIVNQSRIQQVLIGATLALQSDEGVQAVALVARIHAQEEALQAWSQAPADHSSFVSGYRRAYGLDELANPVNSAH
jgi:hypothetical protein